MVLLILIAFGEFGPKWRELRSRMRAKLSADVLSMIADSLGADLKLCRDLFGRSTLSYQG